MISELKSVKCPKCGFAGYLTRQGTEDVMVVSEDNRLKIQTVWICICKNCHNGSKILWIET